MANDVVRNVAAGAAAGLYAKLSVHTSDGGTSGDGEATVSSGRATPVFAAPANGRAALAAPVTATILGASTGSPIVVTHVGGWDADAVWLGADPLAEPRTITSSPYTFTIDGFTIDATGL